MPKKYYDIQITSIVVEWICPICESENDTEEGIEEGCICEGCGSSFYYKYNKKKFVRDLPPK